MMGRRSRTHPDRGGKVSTQTVISELRSVMFDVAVWQDKIATQVGGQLGPVTREQEGGESERRGS